MLTFVLTIHVIVCLLIILLVMMQQGKGAEAGASFGGGSSATVFGSAGSGNFLTRTTGVLAAIFFITSLTLAYMGNKAAKAPILSATPAAPISAPAVAPVQVPNKN